jgi:hypothetical protein
MTWIVYEACHRTDENVHKILVEKLTGKQQFGRIILQWMLNMIGGRRMVSSGSEQGPMAICCEQCI